MKKTIILAYHDIDSPDHPTEKADIPTIQTVVTVSEFEGHMQYLADSGYTVLSVSEYLDRVNSGDYLSEKSIILTFDDGHISNYHYALPILQKHSFHATFFVVDQFIDTAHYMGAEEINMLLSQGMEIGSHSLTHSYLTEVDKNQVVMEIVESKKNLEQKFKRQVNVFAYPGGHHTKKIVDCVRSAGYKAAVSCIVGRNSSETDPFLLRRVELRRGTSVGEFKKAISSGNIFFFQCVDICKLFLKKTIGLQVYGAIRQKFYHLYPFKR